MIAAGNLVMDPRTLTILNARTGKHAGLSHRQAIILAQLMSPPDWIVSRDTLGLVLWPDGRDRPSSWHLVLGTEIHRLRDALGGIGLRSSLVTRWRSGWMIRGHVTIVRVYTPEQAAIADAAVSASPNESTPI